LGMVK